MSLKPQSIRRDTTVYLNDELVEKAIIIELSESWSEREEKLFRKMLQQGGKFKLQGNSFRIVKEEKMVNSKGVKDEGIIQIPGLDTKF
ncbi:hypothetical protein N9F16_00315 [bacterium]|nr:hypothetical protein [bacterium]